VPEIVEAALKATRHAAQLADRLVAIGRLQPHEPRSLELNRLIGELEQMIARMPQRGQLAQLDRIFAFELS